MRLHKLLLHICVLGISVGFAGTTVYDLKTDWSETQNPNGQWAYNQGSSALPWSPNIYSLGGQSCWAPSPNHYAFLPMVCKASTDGAAGTSGILKGDIFIHGVDPSNGDASKGEGNITWTSPSAGQITVNMTIWYAHNSDIRSDDFVLSLGSTTLQSGTVSYPGSRTAPVTYSSGILTVNAGDVVRLVVKKNPASQYPGFAGVDLTVTLSTDVAGTFAHIASGGSWKTSFTLVNPSGTQADARLTFRRDDGSPLSLPLTFPQAGGPAPTTASSVSVVVPPNGLRVVETEADELRVGWAQLEASASVMGSAVFRQRVSPGKDAEAVVPLASPRQNTASWVLPYDNTTGFVTGVALANQSLTAAANLVVVLRDDAGNQLSIGMLSLPAGGHMSFVVPIQFPSLSGMRGTLEFQNPVDSGIAVLGLRFNQYGSFTSIPVMTR